MYNNKKIRISIILFLSFFVLSSKNILIYNEETLVALSFFCFVFFVNHSFGNNITDSLNERSQSIHKGLVDFLNTKSSTSKKLLTQHQKVSGLVKNLKTIRLFTIHECTRLKTQGKKALNNCFQQQLQQKLNNLELSKSALQLKIFDLLATKVYSYLLISFQKAKQQKTSDGNLASQLQRKLSKKAFDSLASTNQ